MKIGELAARTGVSTKAIRYYEDIGVLPEPPRAPNGYRLSDRDSTERLQFIQDAQSAGLSLIEIQMILDLRDGGQPSCGHVISVLEGHLAQVETQLADLVRTRERITALIDDAGSMDPAECDDPNRCQTIPKGNQ